MQLDLTPVKTFYQDIIGLPIPKFPTRLTQERKAAAVEHWREETQEFLDAETLEDEIDAALDLAWLAIGRVIEMGADVEGHWAELLRANGTRVRGQSPKRPNSQGYDAVKPEGWQGPDHTSVLARSRPKIILLGHARHGKDTVAEMLRDRHGFKFQSSSMFCAEQVMMPYFAAKGDVMDSCPRHGIRHFRPYASVEECYADRVNFRDVWYDQISAYNVPDKARLCRELFETNDIYVGMRAEDEFRAAQSLADVVVWVDASGRGLPPEDRSSCTVTPDMADMTLPNNGTLEDLERAVDAFIDILERTK